MKQWAPNEIVDLARTLDYPDGWGILMTDDEEPLTIILRLPGGAQALLIATTLPTNELLQAELRFYEGDTEASVRERAARVMRKMRGELRRVSAVWN
jgi:hypothetical protein